MMSFPICHPRGINGLFLNGCSLPPESRVIKRGEAFYAFYSRPPRIIGVLPGGALPLPVGWWGENYGLSFR
jgi:hypothetical protein